MGLGLGLGGQDFRGFWGLRLNFQMCRIWGIGPWRSGGIAPCRSSGRCQFRGGMRFKVVVLEGLDFWVLGFGTM